MILDLRHLTDNERTRLLLQTGNRLERVSHPDIHPDSPSSLHFYRLHLKEDLLDTARRKRVERQERKSQHDELLAGRTTKENVKQKSTKIQGAVRKRKDKNNPVRKRKLRADR